MSAFDVQYMLSRKLILDADITHLRSDYMVLCARLIRNVAQFPSIQRVYKSLRENYERFRIEEMRCWDQPIEYVPSDRDIDEHRLAESIYDQVSENLDDMPAEEEDEIEELVFSEEEDDIDVNIQ